MAGLAFLPPSLETGSPNFSCQSSFLSSYWQYDQDCWDAPDHISLMLILYIMGAHNSVLLLQASRPAPFRRTGCTSTSGMSLKWASSLGP